MPPRPHSIDDDAEPVIVPRSERPLVALAGDRVDRLRRHLDELIRTAARVGAIPAVRAAPDGFAAEVVRTACTLCRGWCCRNGGDDGFLDEVAVARVLRDAGGAAAGPREAAGGDAGGRDVDGGDAEGGHANGGHADSVRRYYLDRLPPLVAEGSCIFHGQHGCTLDRWARSDVCNVYYCGGLHAYLTSGDPGQPVMVLAGEATRIRRSPVLSPVLSPGSSPALSPVPPPGRVRHEP